jgi:hypothetical protein
MSIGRQYDGRAAVIDGMIAALTFPTRSERGFGEIAVGRDLDGDTRVTLGSIASVAIPTDAIIRIRHVTVLGNLDGDADVTVFPKSSAAFPVPAGRIDMRIRRQLHYDAAPFGGEIAPVAIPAGAV